MKKIIFFYLLGLCFCSMAQSPPKVNLTFPPNIPKTIYNYQTIRIPMHMSYQHLRWHKIWGIEPIGSFYNMYAQLENAAGKCPYLENDIWTWHSGECDMNIVVNGKGINNTMQAYISYHVNGERKLLFQSPIFMLKIIPRPLSMVAIPQQKATTGMLFTYLLNRAILNYGESMEANLKVNLEITAEEQRRLNELGLYYNPANFSVMGIPNRAGEFSFRLGASNAYGKTAPTVFDVIVGFNPNDKPIFKTTPIIYKAFLTKQYKLYLLDLLEEKRGFTKTNQITFRFAEKTSHPDWLQISKDYPPTLEGIPDMNMGGQIVEVTVIATSNTGGDSNPYTIHIPIVYDQSRKPTIDLLFQEQEIETDFFVDLMDYVPDYARDASLKVKVDQIKPTANWLQVASNNPHALMGKIPATALGMRYEITLHVHTDVGGNSDAVTIPLQIKTDERYKPRFRETEPDLPSLHPGQAYSYDFAANKEIMPEYEDIPYTVQFAPESVHPAWLKIENNQLIADKVPEVIADEKIYIQVVINNIPGGSQLSNLVLPIKKPYNGRKLYS